MNPSRVCSNVLRLLLLLACAACDPGDPLSDFSDVTLGLVVPPFASSGDPTHRVSVQLYYTIETPAEGDCLVLPGNTRAHINGHPLEVVERGRFYRDWIFSGAVGCFLPSMVTRLTPQELGLDQEVSLIEISDGSTTLAFEALNVSKERTFTFDLPQGATLRPGQEVAIKPSVMTDKFDPNSGVHVRLNQSKQERVLPLVDKREELGHMLFKMTDFTSAETATLRLMHSGQVEVGVRRCSGLRACTGHVFFYQVPELSVNLIP